MTPRNWLLGLAGGLLLWLGSSAMPGQDAAAQCCSPPPPPPCCTPPSPPPCCTPPSPPPRPPSPPTCCTTGNRTNIIVNSSAVAVAVSGAGAGAGAVVYGGGGGGGYYSPPTATGMIQLDVEGVKKTRQVAYEATRTRTKRVVIRAFCLDDRDIPHPASQVFPDRDIEDGYEGELYRCIAGSRMQITVAEWAEQIAWNGGQTMMCGKGEALFRTKGNGADGGSIACRPQLPARDCNERSLLRRFGAGIKVLTIITVEKYTAYREETYTESSASSMTMSLDGGVGGVVY